MRDDEMSLDEAVYDLANKAAAYLVNGEGADYETAHDIADHIASDINNQGPDAQREFLERWDHDIADDIRKYL